MVTPVNGKPFVMPIQYEAAKYIAGDILKTLRKVAPQMLLQ
jgi:hypothetical protein